MSEKTFKKLDIPIKVTGVDQDTSAALRRDLELHLQHLRELPADCSPTDRAKVLLELADTQLALGSKEESWTNAREAFDAFVAGELWQQAVEACNLMYQTDQPDSIIALGHGVWLAVTYPIEPDTTVAMLQHIVDETPDNSDGAAVAVATAHFIADLRSNEEKRESLTFLTAELMARVARRHSNVHDQQAFDQWVENMGLKNPDDFLPRMATVIDAIVGGKWWIDRDALRAKLPVN